MPTRNLVLIPCADKPKGENARTFQRHPRGTKSGGRDKYIRREVKAGYCSRLNLLIFFIRIHCTFNFQMFGGFLLFPA